jgi:hypothetical protein
MTFPFVNRKKICLIVNSNISQSLVDAQWYAQQRGLDPSLILSFDFAEWDGISYYGGTNLSPYAPISLRSANSQSPLCTTAGYTNLTFVQAASQFIQNNTCEGVICSTYTPVGVVAVTLAQYASNAYYWLSANSGNVLSWTVGKGYGNTSALGTNIPVAKYLTLVGNSATSGGVIGPDVFPNSLFSTWKADNFPQVPHGRLGISLNSTAGNAANPLSAYLTTSEVMNPLNTSQSIMYRCVSDAMAAEQQDNRSKLHLFSTDQYYVNLTAAQNGRAYNYANFVGVNAATVNMSGGTYSVAQFNSGQVPQWFGYAIGESASPNGSGWNTTQRETLYQGAYYLNYVSASAQYLGVNALKSGCCATIGTFAEPLSTNCGPAPGDVFKVMYQTGCSMMEANFLCCEVEYGQAVCSSTSSATGFVRASGFNTILGDPLYSPYVATNTTSQYIYPGIGTGVTFPDGTVQGR